jgi:hypothetical protein
MSRTKKFRKKTGKAPAFRNAAPSAPRAPRNVGVKRDSTLRRLGYTAAGAAGTALVGSLLAREGWAPKTIATALAAVGAGLAWKGDEESIRSVGAGAMSAAGSQLALMLIDDHDKAASTSAASSGASASSPPATQSALKPANAGELPPGALESAFERAKARLAANAPMEFDT